jgi:hypothetical protein
MKLKSVLSDSLASTLVQTVAGYWMVLVDVAESEESSITLRCIMEYHPGPQYGFWEMAFDFAIKDGNDFFYSQDREFVRKYLPDDVTGDAILEAVKQCYKMLIERANAHQIYRASGANLPDKALKKYKELTDVVLSLGYELIDEGTNDYDSQYWLCQKLNI